MRRLGKALLIVVLAAAVVVLLFTQVFPRVERYLEDPTFETGAPPAGDQRSRSTS